MVSTDQTPPAALQALRSSVLIHVADVGVDVTGPGLTARDALNIENRRYIHLSAEGLPPGSDLILSLSNLPLASSPTRPAASTPSILWSMVMGLGTMVTLLLLVYPFLKASRSEQA